MCVHGCAYLLQYLQFYVERMDRLRWHAELGLQAQVAAENKLRLNTETMLRFISHEGIRVFVTFFIDKIIHVIRVSLFSTRAVRNPQNAIALSADSLLMEATENPDTFSSDHIRIFEIVRSSSEFITALLEGMQSSYGHDILFNIFMFVYTLFPTDVLNFQRLSDNKVALTMLPFCPMEFLTNMAHSLSIVLGSKKLEFLTHVDPRLAAFFCEGDKHRIQQVKLTHHVLHIGVIDVYFFSLIQVVSNFVSNAAKFTPVGGQVKMTAMLCQSEDAIQPPAPQSWVRIRIAVKDSGIGISDTDQVCTHVSLPTPQSWVRIRIAVKDSGIGISDTDQVCTPVSLPIQCVLVMKDTLRLLYVSQTNHSVFSIPETSFSNIFTNQPGKESRRQRNG